MTLLQTSISAFGTKLCFTRLSIWQLAVNLGGSKKEAPAEVWGLGAGASMFGTVGDEEIHHPGSSAYMRGL
jgi:hypothetical protein